MKGWVVGMCVYAPLYVAGWNEENVAVEGT